MRGGEASVVVDEGANVAVGLLGDLERDVELIISQARDAERLVLESKVETISVPRGISSDLGSHAV